MSDRTAALRPALADDGWPARSRWLVYRLRLRFWPSLAVALVALACLLPSREVAAEGANVPAAIQAQLIRKVPAYDRGFRERAAPRVGVFVLYKAGNAESQRLAKQMAAALEQQEEIAGLPHDTNLFVFSEASKLAEEAKKRSTSIVYVPPGFAADLDPICHALHPLKVMTITPVPDYVRRCMVLGFDLESGKPKIVVHLGNAKKSGIDFSAAFLRLAKVYR